MAQKHSNNNIFTRV